MDKDSTRRNLLVEKDLVESQIKKFEVHLDKLRKTKIALEASISWFSDSSTILEEHPKEFNNEESNLLGSTETVRLWFKNNPERTFRLNEIGRYLELRKKEGFLKSKNEDIARSAGYIMKRLVEEGYVTNTGRLGRPMYILSMQDE